MEKIDISKYTLKYYANNMFLSLKDFKVYQTFENHTSEVLNIYTLKDIYDHLLITGKYNLSEKTISAIKAIKKGLL